MSTEPCMSGTVLLDARWAIAQVYGEDVMGRALNHVSFDVREVFEGATHVSWVPCDVVHQVFDAVAAEVGLSPQDMAERIVPLSIERSLKTVWRAFLGVSASDEALFARAPLLYARARSIGGVIARVTGPGSGEMLIHGWPKMPDRDIGSLAIGAAAVLRLAGRRAVRVETMSLPDGGRITLRWRG